MEGEYAPSRSASSRLRGAETARSRRRLVGEFSEAFEVFPPIPGGRLRLPNTPWRTPAWHPLAETRWTDFSFQELMATQDGFSVCLTALPYSGYEQQERTSAQICQEVVNCRGTIMMYSRTYINPLTPYALARSSQSIRFVVVVDKQPSSAITPATVFASGGASPFNSWRNQEWKERFEVLFDEIMSLNPIPVIATAESSNTAPDVYVQYQLINYTVPFDFSVPLRKLEARFENSPVGQPTAVNEVLSNNVWLFTLPMLVDSLVVNTPPILSTINTTTVQLHGRYKFRDI